MLLIFDLDDTLINTSEEITPFRLERALKKMVEGGLVVRDFEEAKRDLLRINEMVERSSEAIYHFVGEYKGDIHHLDMGIKEMNSVYLDGISLKSDEEMKELFRLWKEEGHTLAIVTRGNFTLQMEKIDKAGIDKSLFYDIIITFGDKKPLYEEVQNELRVPKEEVLVVGDRILVDLKGAYELGYTTVHMKRGRGKRQNSGFEWVHYSISQLKELNPIILSQGKQRERT